MTRYMLPPRPRPHSAPAGPAGRPCNRAGRVRTDADGGEGGSAGRAAMLGAPMKFGLYASAESPAPGAPAARVPATLPEVYASLLEDARVAEAAGFDGFFVSEHHGSPVDHLPQPLLFLAAVAAATRRIELGATVIQLPLHHPLEVAEQIAVL